MPLSGLLCSCIALNIGSRPPTIAHRATQPIQALDGLPPLDSLPALVSSASTTVFAAAAALGAAAVALGGGPAGRPRRAVPARADAYDPEAAREYYTARLPAVAARLLKLASLTGGFNVRLGLDYLAYKRMGEPEETPWPNEKARAKEALALATQLGPTFIKLAQALSIRTDLIPEAYALELRQLQDAVPPFDSTVAKGIIAQELGAPSGDAAGLGSIFKRLSGEPLAAASIGQVYKGELPDGRQVAVKVQRPNILDDIALDLFLLRLLTPLQTRVSNGARRAHLSRRHPACHRPRRRVVRRRAQFCRNSAQFSDACPSPLRAAASWRRPTTSMRRRTPTPSPPRWSGAGWAR